MCLRMLYDEGLPGPLELESAINSKGRIEFRIMLPVDDAKFEQLKKRFETMIG